jgi:uracil-DNA glycosylase
MRPLLVGEQPSRTGDRYWEFPLSGAVAQALCQMAEIPPEPEGTRYGRWTWALYERFDCINIIERYEPWDAAKAATSLDFASGIAESEVFVLLGRRAQQAYVDMQAPGESVLDGADWFEWKVDPSSPTGRREVVVIPHPSARNQTYLADRMKVRSGEVLRAAIEKAKQMEETRL